MQKLIRLWNQNRRLVILAVGVLVFLIIVIQVLNQVAKAQREEKEASLNSLTEVERNLPTDSIIGQGSVSVEDTKENLNEIDEFIEKCNNGDLSGAYSMLTDYCKKTFFETEELFKTGYFDIVFSERRTPKTSNYMNSDGKYTYLVKLYNDALSTGEASGEIKYQDYYTIDKKSENGKINIKGLIGRKEINKEKQIDGIKIIVLSQLTFKDKERYEIRVENATDKTMLINSGKQTKPIYLVDNNGTIYNSNVVEIAKAQQQVPSYTYRVYTLDFSKKYDTNAKSAGIAFVDMIKNYEEFENSQETLKDRLKISVEF